MCSGFKDTADAISKVALKMFLGVYAEVADWDSDFTAYHLLLKENPITELVELPEGYENLRYCNLLCGVIRGALEQVNLKVAVVEERSVLTTAEPTLLKVTLVDIIKDDVPTLND